MLVAIDTTGDVTGTEDAEYIQEFGKSINVFDDGDGGTVKSASGPIIMRSLMVMQAVIMVVLLWATPA